MKNENKQETTWEPHDSVRHGPLSAAKKNALPSSAFAFPHTRKEPMTDASHIRNAMARFDQVEGVTNSEKDLAFSNIHKAARHFNIHMTEKDWHEFGSKRT